MPGVLIKSVLYILDIDNNSLLKILFIWEDKYHILAGSYSPMLLNLNADQLCCIKEAALWSFFLYNALLI